MTGIELAVDLAKLAMAEAEIQKALAIYRQAVAKAKAAAEALCEKWEGDAASEFAREQGVAYQWHMSIVDIITSFIGELERTIKMYQEAQEKIKSLITSK